VLSTEDREELESEIQSELVDEQVSARALLQALNTAQQDTYERLEEIREEQSG
jgi:hypothetical protein